MIELDIPSFGRVELHHVVCDFTGTLSVDGKLLDGVAERIRGITKDLAFHVLTADTFGTAEREMAGLSVVFRKLTVGAEDEQKADYVRRLNPEQVIAIGNGNNDHAMLALARIGVAVIGTEGASRWAVQAADLVVTDALNALDLLLHPKRLLAGLRS
jgi:P-type E1-E2 ATPase